MPCLPLRTVPLEEHDTSYFADSASIRSRSIVFSVSMVSVVFCKITAFQLKNVTKTYFFLLLPDSLLDKDY